MKIKKSMLLLSISLLAFWSLSCFLIDVPMQILRRFTPLETTDAMESIATITKAVSPTAAVALEPTATETPFAVPTATMTLEPSATQDNTLIAEETLIYRANLEHTGVYQSSGPKTSPNLAWRYDTQGVIGRSSPAIYLGLAYIGSETGVYAVDIQTGQRFWHYKTDGSVSTSPSIVDGIIYFGSEDGLLHALDSIFGEPLWTFKTGYEIHSSPIIFDGIVYFGCDDGFLYALDALTGLEIWKFEVDGNVDPITGIFKAVRSAPAISNGSILFGNTQIGGASSELVFYALDLKTGQKRWEYQTWNLNSSPVIADGVVYFGSFMSFLGLDLVSGSSVFTYGTDWGISPPAILDGIAYFGCDNGYIHALDLQANEEIWVFDTGRSVSIDTAPSIADGVVYTGSGDGFMYAVDLQTGEKLWEFETGGWISSSPVISEGVLYFGSADGYLYALK